MKLRTLASGSSGNCILISADGGHVLVDCGISCKRITAALSALGVAPADLRGVLITHEHSDHISGLATLTKKLSLPVYASPGTARQLLRRMWWPEGLLRPVEPGRPFQIGPFEVGSFPTSHDAEEPTGFTLSCGGRKAAVVTDLGYVTDDVLDGALGAHLVVCESNHDTEWLRSGPYPYYLKARILGDRGHLSNEAGAALALQCVEKGAHTVLLAHLSAQNNTPQQARSTAEAVLRSAGIDPDRDMTLAVAPRSEPSPSYEV